MNINTDISKFDFSANTELVSLTLPYPCHLSQMDLPSLKKFSLRLQCHSLEQLGRDDHIEWDCKLESLLSTKLRDIQEIKILYLSSFSHKTVPERWSSLFPRTSKKVTVKFIPTEGPRNRLARKSCC